MEIYKNLGVIGTGQFGTVKKVVKTSNQEVLACKVMRFRDGVVSQEDAQREYAILSHLSHPNIVKYVDYSWQSDKAKLYMEYCSEGSLQDYVTKTLKAGSAIPESMIWSVFAQLASALVYCHYGVYTRGGGGDLSADWKTVIHRDIKPANVLLSSITPEALFVKLGDFGFSKIIDSDSAPSTYAGTPQYMPPEITRRNKASIRWTKKCDIFSLGCTLYTMCTLNPPFDYRMELENTHFQAIPDCYSSQLRKCIDTCMSFHPEDRHDAFDLLGVIRRLQKEPIIEPLAPPLAPPAFPADVLFQNRTTYSPSLNTPNEVPPVLSTEPQTIIRRQLPVLRNRNLTEMLPFDGEHRLKDTGPYPMESHKPESTAKEVNDKESKKHAGSAQSHINEIAPSGGLGRMKSIREVAKGAYQINRDQSITPSMSTKPNAVLRRKSAKMFGEKIIQINPKPGSQLSQLDPIPQNTALSDKIPQRQPSFRIIRGQLIDEGTSGKIYLGMNANTGEILAVKKIEINQKAVNNDKDKMKEIMIALNQEINIMQHLKHPNIIQYLGCQRDELSISIYLEYISSGSIGDCLRKHGKFEESVVKSLTIQILRGLAYLHDQSILHRDLKADNILLDIDGICKISSFGISKRLDNIYGKNAINSIPRSVFWMAPEVIQSRGEGYSGKADIWSVGCVILEMFAGRRPWEREEAIGAFFKLGSLKQAPPIPEAVSEAVSPVALAFLYDCFAIDVFDRPTAGVLLSQHPFCIPHLRYNFEDTELYAKIRYVL